MPKLKIHWSLLIQMTKWPGEFSLKSHYCRLCWQKKQVPCICLKFGEPVGRAARSGAVKNGGSHALLLSLSSLVNFKKLEGAPSTNAQEKIRYTLVIYYTTISCLSWGWLWFHIISADIHQLSGLCSCIHGSPSDFSSSHDQPQHDEELGVCSPTE